MPSQKQLKWSQLRVGITVIAASLTLGLLLFLMSGTSGLFTPRITLISYFNNAGGLRKGAPVRLSGVDIGNVIDMRIVPDHDEAADSGRSHDEGQHEVRIQSAPRLRLTSLRDRGSSGRDLSSTSTVRRPIGPPAQDGRHAGDAGAS